jgi:hypothetical protein
VYCRFCKGENAFMLCRGFGALKPQKGWWPVYRLSKVPVPSDHKSPEDSSPSSMTEGSRFLRLHFQARRFPSSASSFISTER